MYVFWHAPALPSTTEPTLRGHGDSLALPESPAGGGLHYNVSQTEGARGPRFYYCKSDWIVGGD